MIKRGLYVHVPFCTKKCYYCDFNSYKLNELHVEPYLTAVQQEIERYGELLSQGKESLPFDTVFVGGGTPTTLLPGQLSRLFGWLRRELPVTPDAEITVEANPETINGQKLEALLGAGVNRLSMGVQSLDGGLLERLGRVHSAQDAVDGFHLARKAGFTNINLDLMFALPGQSIDQWKGSLLGLLELEPDHLSCYSLIIEEGTPYYGWHQQGRLALPDEDTELEMYEWAISTLAARTYEQYEISNFARPGHRCRHNIIYWHNDQWLGLGPGAHSHWNGERFSNVRPPAVYNKLLANGELPVDRREPVEIDAAMDETMMLGLRLLDGVRDDRFRQRFGYSLFDVYGSAIDRLAEWGLVDVNPEGIRLSRRGLPLANRVFAEFLRVPIAKGA